MEMCRSGRLSKTVCPDTSDDPEERISHFPCWPCIRSECRADSEALARANQAALEAKEAAAKAKHATEARLREERLRREYRDRAAREREDEARRKEEREREAERAKKEGGLWIETGAGRRGRHRKGPLTPVTPLVSSPAIRTILTRDKKENMPVAGGSKMSPAKKSPAKTSPPKDKPTESSGRAGVWGPKKNDSNASKRENTGTGLRN
jgi:hypothetical protein